jgi:hypothetical protein
MFDNRFPRSPSDRAGAGRTRTRAFFLKSAFSRHAHHGGETARGSGSGPAIDILGGGHPRVAQVHVHVEQPREHQQARSVQHPVALLRPGPAAQRLYQAAANDHVHAPVDIACGVDHPPTEN